MLLSRVTACLAGDGLGDEEKYAGKLAATATTTAYGYSFDSFWGYLPSSRAIVAIFTINWRTERGREGMGHSDGSLQQVESN